MRNVTKSLDDNNVEGVVFSYEGGILQYDKTLGEQVPTHHLSDSKSVIKLQARLTKRVRAAPVVDTEQSAVASGFGGSILSSLALTDDESGVQAAEADELSMERSITATNHNVSDQGLGLAGSTLGSLALAEAACSSSTTMHLGEQTTGNFSAPAIPFPQPPACSVSRSTPTLRMPQQPPACSASRSAPTDRMQLTRHLTRFMSESDDGVFELCFMFSSPVAPTDLNDLDFTKEKDAIKSSLVEARVPVRFGAQVATTSHIIATVTRASRRTIIHLAGHGEQAGFHAEKETGEGAMLPKQTLVSMVEN